MQFIPESEVGLKLKGLLVPEIERRYGKANDDSQDIADYMMYLIAANKAKAEIVSEIKDIADIPIDESFVNDVYVEINRLQSEVHGQEPAQPASSDIQIDEQPPAQPEQNTQVSIEVPQHVQLPNIPKGPASQLSEEERRELRSQRFGTARGGRGVGISKPGHARPDRMGFKKNFQNVKRMERALEVAGDAGVRVMNTFTVQAPKGRCPDFPYCKNKECERSHPTKNCFAYPNCPNPPGTCNFLHPDQDQDLIAKLQESRKEFEQKKINRVLVQQGSCKFGAKCTKATCPYAHPTPASETAVIETLEWCADGKKCQDPNCTKSHPPPPTATAVTTGPSATDIALEQCKFGSQCTNVKCPRRHATSGMPCRQGETCRRLDCTFAHPIKEPCHFGIKCHNRYCMFQHPEGRTVSASHTWSKDSQALATSDRSFAVPEDQIMEQAVQD